MLNNGIKQIEKVIVGTEGLSVDVPVMVTRGGRTKFDLGMLVETSSCSNGFGQAVVTDAIRQIIRREGFTHPMEKIASCLSQAIDTNGQFSGVEIRIQGLNIGYPYIDLSPVSVTVS